MPEPAGRVLAAELRRLFAASSASHTTMELYGKQQRPPVKLDRGKVSAWMSETRPAVPKQWCELEAAVAHLRKRVPAEHRATVRDMPWFRQMHALALHESARIRGGRPAIVPTTRTPIVLPVDPPGFVGRDDESAGLLAWLGPATTETVTTAVLSGMAGVGKSALAVRVAHRAVAWFPGGVVAVNLHGYSDGNRMSADQVAARLLRDLGRTGPDAPRDALSAWRDHSRQLADAGQRLLVLLDNVATDTQVWDLLLDPPHRVLITSRHRLAHLPAQQIPLNPLGDDESASLLHEVAATESAELARLCGGLPLALRIIAAHLREDPHQTPAALLTDLRDSRDRLDVLEYHGSDEQGRPLAVRAALDLSYQHLDPDQSLLLRMLTLNPGPDIGTEAAAVLLDAEPKRTRRLLARLAAAHLLRHEGDDRWTTHDLIRIFAAEKAIAQPAVLAEGIGRLVPHMVFRTVQAALAFSGGDSDFPDEQAALRWIEREQSNLVATVAVYANRFPGIASTLTMVLYDYLEKRHNIGDLLTLTTAAIREYPDLPKNFRWYEVFAHHGSALILANRSEEAIEVLQQARADSVQRQDRRGELTAACQLGTALLLASRYAEAIAVLRPAAEVATASGRLAVAAAAQNSLATALIGIARFDEASATYTAAAEAFRQLGDRRGEAIALGNASSILFSEKRVEEAKTAFARAAEALDAVGDRYSRAALSANTALLLSRLGQPAEAMQLALSAARTLAELGDAKRAAAAYRTCVELLSQFHEHEAIVNLAAPMAAQLQQMATRNDEDVVLGHLAHALTALGRFTDAIPFRARLVELLGPEATDAERAARLTALGNDMLLAGQFAEAAPVLEKAVAAAPPEQPIGVRARVNLGTALANTNRADAAAKVLRAAAELGERLGDNPMTAAYARFNLATVLSSQGLADEAAEQTKLSLRLLASLEPAVARRVLTELAEKLEAEGDAEDAAAARRHIELLPRTPESGQSMKPQTMLTFAPVTSTG